MNMFPQLCSVTVYPNTVCAAVLARQSQGTEHPSYSCLLKENFVVHFAALLWAREGETVVLKGSKSPSCPQSLNYLCCNGRVGESLCFTRQHDWSLCRHPMSAWTNIVTRKQAHRAHMSQTGISRTQRKKGLMLTRHCDSVLTASSLSRAGKRPSCISVRIWFVWPTVTLCYSAKQKYPLPCQTTRDRTT